MLIVDFFSDYYYLSFRPLRDALVCVVQTVAQQRPLCGGETTKASLSAMPVACTLNFMP